MRGAYIATTAPYLNIWCLQYFPFIQRRQRNRYNICLFLSNYHIRRHMCLVLSPIDLNLAGHQKHIHNYVSARLFTLSFIGVSDCLPYLLDSDNSSLGSTRIINLPPSNVTLLFGGNLFTGLLKSVESSFLYSRIHEKLLILYFENARGAAPSVLKEKNQQFRVYSTT